MKGENPDNKIKLKFRQRLKLLPKEFFLSHHPNCPPYKNHTFIIFQRKLCIGCFIGYPSALLAFIIGSILIQISEDYSFQIFWIAISFMMAIFLSFTGLTEKKSIKIMQKFLSGFGAGFFITYLFYFPGVSIWLKIITIFITITSINLVLNVLHYKKHNKICDSCEFNPGINQCPGYKSDRNLDE